MCLFRIVPHAAHASQYYYFPCKWNHPTDTIQLNKTKRLRDATNRIVRDREKKKLSANAQQHNDHFQIEADDVCTVVFCTCLRWKCARINSVKMKCSIKTILFAILFVISVLSKPIDAEKESSSESSSEEDESSVVETESGRVRGRKNYTLYESKAFYAFKGIPYARAPVEELRFKVNWHAPSTNCGPLLSLSFQFVATTETGALVGHLQCLWIRQRMHSIATFHQFNCWQRKLPFSECIRSDWGILANTKLK